MIIYPNKICPPVVPPSIIHQSFIPWHQDPVFFDQKILVWPFSFSRGGKGLLTRFRPRLMGGALLPKLRWSLAEASRNVAGFFTTRIGDSPSKFWFVRKGDLAIVEIAWKVCVLDSWHRLSLQTHPHRYSFDQEGGNRWKFDLGRLCLWCISFLHIFDSTRESLQRILDRVRRHQ